MAIAKQRGQLLVVDDKEARSVAGALGLDFVGATGVLLEAFLEEHLDLEGLEGALMDLSRVTWLSPGVVATVLKVAREER